MATVTIRGYVCDTFDGGYYFASFSDNTASECPQPPTKAELDAVFHDGWRRLNLSFSGDNIERLPDELPTDVQRLFLFISGTKIREVQNLSSNVESFSASYAHYLEKVCELPSGIKTVQFTGCHNLKSAPVIPASVTYLKWAFLQCYSLEGPVIINAQAPYNYDECFKDTNNLIALSGSSPVLNEIAETANNGNVYIFTPPSVPPQWETPVTNREAYSRTNWNDINRIVNNTYLLGGYPYKMEYEETDFVVDKEWEMLLHYTNKFADELDMRHATNSTAYSNLNHIETIHREYHGVVYMLYPSNTLLPSDELYPKGEDE